MCQYIVNGEERINARNNEEHCTSTRQQKRHYMRRSKMEMYLDILKVLSDMGPLKLTHIMQKGNFNCNLLEGCLYSLIKQGLVEVQTIKRERKIYLITQRGVTVLKQFREIAKVLSIVGKTETNTKNQRSRLY
jgi:predicted transcriptional regulator